MIKKGLDTEGVSFSKFRDIDGEGEGKIMGDKLHLFIEFFNSGF